MLPEGVETVMETKTRRQDLVNKVGMKDEPTEQQIGTPGQGTNQPSQMGKCKLLCLLPQGKPGTAVPTTDSGGLMSL